ncbi:MAG: histidine phosphatase family protein [Anaerolineae bacterium]|nr:histidine phosphatase family protein [Anaerolineae bacterium]
MATLTTITMIRHGETDWNVNGRWQGQAPVPLNNLGREQARITAEFLATNGHRYDRILASDLSRAFHTAQAIVEQIGGEIERDTRLREIDLGEWQGLTNAEVEAWDGERLKLVRADTLNAVRPGGESWAQVGARAYTCICDCAKQKHGQRILVVSHGGTIRAILNHLGLLEVEMAHIDNCSRTILSTADTEKWELTSYNLIDHLDALRDQAHHWKEDNFSRF